MVLIQGRTARLIGAFAALCGLWAPGASALDPRKSLTQYSRTIWTQERGLPQDTIRTITQTKDGYIWLGSQNGLVRFDGLEFKLVPIDLPEAQGQDVKKVITSRDGKIRFAINNGGFGSYDGQTLAGVVKNARPRLSLVSFSTKSFR